MHRSLVILAATLIAVSAAAYAQPGPGDAPGHPPFMPRGARQMMEKLKLTDKQKAEAAKLHTDLEKSMVEIQAKVKLARIDLRTLVAADAPERSAVEGKLKEISDLQYQEKKLVADHAFDFYALLTPEQQKTARAGLLRMLSGGGMRWGGRMMGDRGGMMEDRGGMMEGHERMKMPEHTAPDNGGTNK